MEDKYYKSLKGSFEADLDSLYHPLTNHQFIQTYNFNNPKVEDLWEAETKKLVGDSLKEIAMRSLNKEIGEYKIKICYL